MLNESMVFVVDDDSDARDSVCALVQSMGMRVTGFPSAESFLDEFDERQRGCLITDLRLIGMSGLDLMRELGRWRNSPRVILVSGFVNVSETVDAMKIGAETVLIKPFHDQELWDAIQRAVSRDAQIRDGILRRCQIEEQLASLTLGERDVLDFIVDGAANKVVARRLEISLRTVEDRRRKIMQKLAVTSFAALLAKVLEFRQGN